MPPAAGVPDTAPLPEGDAVGVVLREREGDREAEREVEALPLARGEAWAETESAPLREAEGIERHDGVIHSGCWPKALGRWIRSVGQPYRNFANN